MGHLKKEDIEKLDTIRKKYSMYPPFSRGNQSLEDFYHTMFLSTHIGVQIGTEDFEYIESLLGLKNVEKVRLLPLDIEDPLKYVNPKKARIIWECGTTEIVINSKPYYFKYLMDEGKAYMFEGDVDSPFDGVELSETNCEIIFTVETRKGLTGKNVDGWVLSKIVVK